jgi:hypothetical protein
LDLFAVGDVRRCLQRLSCLVLGGGAEVEL